jgi:predicted flap endonuclease-1-like 5' DNA nuclease
MSSLLYSVVFASRCTSNHHRLALDALRHLKSPDAEDWRTLLLHHHVDYLKGAKAPDDTFKDFKNHVLHVREGEWGGAIEACEEWQRRLVRAIKEEDWAQAAWCAGVMSHYYVDPIQPFHTHQTEEENTIHRAVEWSFSKSYGTFQKIIETDLGGYKDVSVPSGDDWLAQMLRSAANESTKHYETIVDHYDFAVGVKTPEAGLDQELKDTMARLVALAAVGLARVLDKTFTEAAMKPPKLNGGLQAAFLALEMPIQKVLAAIADAGARREVEAQYAEFRRTGKVRETLGDDDKVVRELYATEVLKTPLSSLDAKWPRETGTKNGTGAPPRDVKQPKLAAMSPPKTPKAEKPKPAPKPQPVAAALPTPKPAPAPTIEAKPPEPMQRAAAQPAPTPAPQPATPAPAPQAKPEKQRFSLKRESPVVDAPSIGPKTARRLEQAGVKTVSDLLSLTPATGAVLIDQRHISAQVIQDWQAQALLACTVPGLRSREAQALVACGVRDAGELVEFEPSMLAEAITRWTETEDADRAWGEAPPPTEADVSDWIARAKAA